MEKQINNTIKTFAHAYEKRFGNVSIQTSSIDGGFRHDIVSPVLRGKGNYPFVLSHGAFTDHVIILTHGLTDSPYYMEAIGWHFFKAGANVLFPLLFGHGMKYPDKALQDWDLCRHWKADLDNAINSAKLFGKILSLGGLSTGGALSLNALLRHRKTIKGGLFLFSAALDIGFLHENIGKLPLVQTYYRVIQEKIIGTGPNPYKYPIFPNFAGLQLSKLINENNQQLDQYHITQPVFAAHSVQDPHTLLTGVIHLLNHHVENGVAYLIAQCKDGQPVEHGEVVLEKQINFSSDNPYPIVPPKANPKFDDMMCAAIRFFKNEIKSL
ncbi:MAG: alpha/beta hydrolase [Candidatus Magnetomorum sp.]|nr:alpha/beta hydrolase [Candidatus Magnetomorum sp.]